MKIPIEAFTDKLDRWLKREITFKYESEYSGGIPESALEAEYERASAKIIDHLIEIGLAE